MQGYLVETKAGINNLHGFLTLVTAKGLEWMRSSPTGVFDIDDDGDDSDKENGGSGRSTAGGAGRTGASQHRELKLDPTSRMRMHEAPRGDQIIGPVVTEVKLPQPKLKLQKRHPSAAQPLLDSVSAPLMPYFNEQPK